MRQSSMLSLALVIMAVAALGAALLLATQGLAVPAEFSATSPAPSLASRGRALFQAKGCVTCHIQREFTGPRQGPAEGPDLTTYRNDPAFLRRWLADPAAARPGTAMPNLNLNSDEIEALVAFLNE